MDVLVKIGQNVSQISAIVTAFVRQAVPKLKTKRITIGMDAFVMIHLNAYLAYVI
jgi:hypothetical protein